MASWPYPRSSLITRCLPTAACRWKRSSTASTRAAGYPQRSHLAREGTVRRVGGGWGPAGSAAAIYAARKGIRTGLLGRAHGRPGARHPGHRKPDRRPGNRRPWGWRPPCKTTCATMAWTCWAHTAHPRSPPPNQPGAFAELTLSNGAVLKARTVIAASLSQARWREMGVPGEAHYKTRGVAFCPHW